MTLFVLDTDHVTLYQMGHPRVIQTEVRVNDLMSQGRVISETGCASRCPGGAPAARQPGPSG